MILCVFSVLTIDFCLQKAFGWDGTQSGGSPAGPQSGGVGGQGAQGLVHWMSVMAEHMDPAVSHYMSWNQDVSAFFSPMGLFFWTAGRGRFRGAFWPFAVCYRAVR